MLPERVMEFLVLLFILALAGKPYIRTYGKIGSLIWSMVQNILWVVSQIFMHCDHGGAYERKDINQIVK